jgi:molybdate transport repressor ModE-like protein
MHTEKKMHPAFKLWLETDEGYVFGPGIYSLLCKLSEKGTLKEAASSLAMSYRFAWGLLKKAEDKLGFPLLVTHKGGNRGGGGALLTEQGRNLIKEFETIQDTFSRKSGDSLRNVSIDASVVSIADEGSNKLITLSTRSQKLTINIHLNENIKINDKIKLKICSMELRE